MATQRVQIAVSFSYETNVFVASSSGGAVTTATTVINPAVGSAVTVTDRNTGNPAQVFAGVTGSTVLGSVVTDAGGNVPGWVVEGSYNITAAAVGAFAGATQAWEAVRGDGVENVAPNAIGTAQIQDGAVTLAKLATAVAQALCPAGSMLDYGGSAAPSGWLLCDGSIVVQATYPNLFTAIGSAYNIGGEGAGTFRLPDFRQRFALGKATSGTGATLGSYGGSIDHTHAIPALGIPALPVTVVVPNHQHILGTSGGARVGFYSDSNANVNPPAINGQIRFGANSLASWTEDITTHFMTLQSAAHPSTSSFQGTGNQYNDSIPALALTGLTESSGGVFASGASTGTNTTNTGTTGATNPAYMVVNKIIKT